MERWGLFVLMILLMIPLSSAFNETFCNQEEIIKRINDHTDIQIDNAINKYITDKFNSAYQTKQEEFLLNLDNRANEYKFYLKVLVISIFGAVSLALTLYGLMNYLIKRRS